MVNNLDTGEQESGSSLFLCIKGAILGGIPLFRALKILKSALRAHSNISNTPKFTPYRPLSFVFLKQIVFSSIISIQSKVIEPYVLKIFFIYIYLYKV